MEEVSAKTGTTGMPREQWGHGDKRTGDDRKAEGLLGPVDGEI